MERLRKEKQVEFLDDFQAHQQLMCENLQKHMESATSDEDKRIAETVQKKMAKRDVSGDYTVRTFTAGVMCLSFHIKYVLTKDLARSFGAVFF